MFTVDKKQLHNIYGAAVKLVGKFSEIIVDVQQEGLWLIINVESYIRVFVPATVEETGIFKISQEIFQTVFSLRGDTLKCSFNREQNILNVSSGTKTALYVSFRVSEDDYAEPTLDDVSNKLKIKSKNIGEFKKNLDVVKFVSPDVNSHEYALVKNTAETLTMTFASTNICTRYIFSSTLSDTDFSLSIPVDKFRLALSLISTGIKMFVTENYLLIKSDNLTLTLPALIDTQFIGFIENCDMMLENGSLAKGKLVFDVDEVQKTMDSVRSISKGSAVIDFKMKGNSMIISLENNIGTTKDKCEVKENTIDKSLKFTVPEQFIDASFFMASKIGKELEMRFGENFNYFMISIKNKQVDFFTIGPVSEEG